jgi:hypothetical protein
MAALRRLERLGFDIKAFHCSQVKCTAMPRREVGVPMDLSHLNDDDWDQLLPLESRDNFQEPDQLRAYLRTGSPMWHVLSRAFENPWNVNAVLLQRRRQGTSVWKGRVLTRLQNVHKWQPQELYEVLDAIHFDLLQAIAQSPAWTARVGNASDLLLPVLTEQLNSEKPFLQALLHREARREVEQTVVRWRETSGLLA